MPRTPPPTEDGRVVLSHGRTTDAGQRPLRTWRVFGQVAAAAALVLVLVAVLGLGASRRIAERESVNDAARSTDLLADAVVQPALTDGVARSDPAALAALDDVVRARVLGGGVVRVKLWSADGTIVYSDEPRLVGERFGLGDEEADVLRSPATQAEVSDLDEPENRYERSEGKLLEVYRPVWTPDGTVLLFETYGRYDVVTQRAAAVWRGFAGITLTSLLLLLVLLLPVLWALLDRLRRTQEQREQLLQQAVDASDDERRRIAATLHDGVVQELVASSFALAGAADRAERAGAGEAADAVRAASGTVRTSIRGLRSLLVDIYPPSLRTAGLGAALADLAGGLAARGTRVVVDAPDEVLTGMGVPTQQLLYRVAQETVRNAVAHSGADEVRVRVTRAGSRAVLEVVDDGRGFDAAAALAAPQDGHFGLRVLADLAAAAGAELSVVTGTATGTRWRLVVEADGADA